MAEGTLRHLECGGVIILVYVEIDLNIRPGTDQLSGFRWAVPRTERIAFHLS